jgi:hypothetical protein
MLVPVRPDIVAQQGIHYRWNGRVPPPAGGDWEAKCKGLLDFVGRSLGRLRGVFWEAVDPRLLSDYYTVCVGAAPSQQFWRVRPACLTAASNRPPPTSSGTPTFMHCCKTFRA